MNIGVNALGMARFMPDGLDTALDQLVELGFTSLELVIFVTDWWSEVEVAEETSESMAIMFNSMWTAGKDDEKIKLVRDKGLTIKSAHIMECGFFDRLDDPAEVIRKIKQFAVKCQLRYIVISCMKETIAEIEEVMDVIKRLAKALQEVDVMLVYHNHHQEITDKNGESVLDYLIANCPELKVELDVGWVKFAGKDPVVLMKKYRDRLVLLHLKDITSDASEENKDMCFTAIGEGTIDLPGIIAEAKNCPYLDEQGIIIDQDNSMGNIFDDFEVAMKNLAKYSSGNGGRNND